jgi:exodeoxyribonuclease VII large subunit
MAEIVNDKKVFSLYEVTKSIQKTLAERYRSTFWVKAEMIKLNFYKHSGHCYPELVEKLDGKVIAQIKATLWKDNFISINTEFLRVLKEPLKDGIKILFEAKISFDPAYGLALHILDIDPAYTLGDLEKEKNETIKKLQDEGIFDKNKKLKLPLLPQRIAIISVETSKGYADFLDVVQGNPWNYKFFHMLFPSLLQGEKAVEGIIGQLKSIKKVKNHFDVVAIIRGGGGDIGLSCYNNYLLSKEIALFPLPVLTGIGHATNETVTEMISYSNAITPTKLAEYIIQKFHNFSIPIQKAEEKIIDKARRLISDEKGRFISEVKLFRSVTERLLMIGKNDVANLSQSIVRQSQFIFKNEKEHLNSTIVGIRKEVISFYKTAKQDIKRFALTISKDTSSQISNLRLVISHNVIQVVKGSITLVQTRKVKINLITEKLSDRCSQLLKSRANELNNNEKNIINMSPANVLKRGYSITLLNGKAVKNADQVSDGDVINTLVYEGRIISAVTSTKKS